MTESFDAPLSPKLLTQSNVGNPFLAEYMPNPAQNSASVKRTLVGEFVNSLGYAALQHPYEGLRQFANVTTGKESLSELNWFATPETISFTDSPLRRSAQLLGNALGMAVPIFALHRSLRGLGRTAMSAAGFNSHIALASNRALCQAPLQHLGLGITESATVGALYEGVLRPTHEAEGDFWAARKTNAAIGALSFGSWSLAANALKYRDTMGLTGAELTKAMGFSADVKRQFWAGAFAGSIDIEARSKGQASWQDLLTSAGTFALTGATTRGLHQLSSSTKSPALGIYKPNSVADANPKVTRLSDITSRRTVDAQSSGSTIEGNRRADILPFKRPAKKANNEVNRVITEEDIAKFDDAKQLEIKQQIEKLVKKGYPKEFIDLWPDGSVTYNSKGHLAAVEAGEAE